LLAAELVKLTSIYTTPGFTDERIVLYLGLGLSPGEQALESTEFIETETLPVSEALRLVEDGVITDSKTVCTLLFATRFAGLADR
jgi:ADP-ribose pyrophosphatase